MRPFIEAKRPPKLLKSTAYEVFRRRYRDDWAAFAYDCIELRDGETWAEYQLEIFAAFANHPRICVRAPHGAGKTAMEAVACHAFSLTRDGDLNYDWKMPTTASVWRQLTKFLWPEIHKWSRRIRWAKIGRESYNPRTELLAQSLKLDTGEAFAVASDNHESIEGAHASSIMYGFDEAKAIPALTFDAAEGAFSSAGKDTQSEAFAFTISTPGSPEGRFFDIQSRKPGYEDWFVRHITLDEAIRAGRISNEWVRQRRLQWGEGSAVFQNRVLGEFAESSEDSIIPLSWIEQAMDRWVEDDGVLMTSLGVDVGLGGDGSDSTIFAPCWDGVRVGKLQVQARGNVDVATMETAGIVKGKLEVNPNAVAFIDVIGIGAGVVHRLNEMGYKGRIVGFNVAEATRERDATGELGFVNKRAAMWWLMREALNPMDGEGIALPPDDVLVGDLSAPRFSITSGGKIKVEDKREVRKRIGRSPDRADAVLHALFGPRLSQMRKTRIYIPGEGYLES